MNLEAFHHLAMESVKPFDAFVRAHRLAEDIRADHLCYKCGSSEEFDKLRWQFESESFFLFQSIVSERRVAIIRMKMRVPTALGAVDLLELSDQKPDGSQVSGFDHIEAYAKKPDITSETVAGWLKKVGAAVTYQQRPHHSTYDVRIGEGPFKLRLEDGPLLRKIVSTEIRP
jgi:predicted metalloenzyme YecM